MELVDGVVAGDRRSVARAISMVEDGAPGLPVLSAGLFDSLLAAFQREAEDAVADNYAVSMINGLLYDRHDEEVTVHTFISALRAAIEEFRKDPMGPPLVPNWARVWAGVHDAGPWLVSAVHEGGR